MLSSHTENVAIPHRECCHPTQRMLPSNWENVAIPHNECWHPTQIMLPSYTENDAILHRESCQPTQRMLPSFTGSVTIPHRECYIIVLIIYFFIAGPFNVSPEFLNVAVLHLPLKSLGLGHLKFIWIFLFLLILLEFIKRKLDTEFYQKFINF